MCKHPLKAFKIGVNEETGKDILKITSYKVDHLEQVHGYWIKCSEAFVSPHAEKVQREWTEIPCGKCIDCRLQYARQWADRCVYESYYYPENECYFVTLTYNEENIVDVNSDMFPGTLVKEHLQKFMKRLRRKIEYEKHNLYILQRSDRSEKDCNENGVRYFACGEYGSKSFRPHYHLLVYGINLFEFPYENWLPSKSGRKQWRSLYLEDIWKNGFVTFSQFSWDTAAYVARYTLKKVKGITPEYYSSVGLLPEFTVMSRKPGIGRTFFDDHKDSIYEFDSIIQRSPDGGRKAKPPKYYDSCLEKENPELYKRIKQMRKECAEYAKEMKLNRTDLDYESLLQVEEEILSRKVQALKRDLEL